jgi:hypothetical protein
VAIFQREKAVSLGHQRESARELFTLMVQTHKSCASQASLLPPCSPPPLCSQRVCFKKDSLCLPPLLQLLDIYVRQFKATTTHRAALLIAQWAKWKFAKHLLLWWNPQKIMTQRSFSEARRWPQRVGCCSSSRCGIVPWSESRLIVMLPMRILKRGCNYISLSTLASSNLQWNNGTWVDRAKTFCSEI